MICIFFFKIFFPIFIQEAGCLSLKIKREPIISGKDKIELVFSTKNCSKHNLILYNLAESIEANQFEEDFYCNPEITAGITLFIYDAKSEMMWPDLESSDSIAYEPRNEEMIIKLTNQVKYKFHDNMVLAKAHENVEIRRAIDLKPFHLKKGTYTLLLIYFSGKNISNLISSSQMESDKRKYNARIFQGCIRSNEVSLVVE